MKCFRISTTVFQLLIASLLVIFLWWDSTPVPGPDGRIVCDIYEFPFAIEAKYKSVTITTRAARSMTTVGFIDSA